MERMILNQLDFSICLSKQRLASWVEQRRHHPRWQLVYIEVKPCIPVVNTGQGYKTVKKATFTCPTAFITKAHTINLTI